MISYEKRVLSNGLRVIHHYDPNTPLAVVNVLYNVGARDENPELTGMAHLFEHLMFSGSQHAPEYDTPIQLASGENNAFTSNDITNYYVTLPAENLETALWLESDRMRYLNVTQENLETQQSVVIEEFKQRYLNQPYGDLWLLFRPLSYTQHPYSWPTIGKEIAHIEKVTLSDLQSFYQQFYHPANAILVIAGNVVAEQAFKLAEKWFGALEPFTANKNIYPIENEQIEPRLLKVKRKVNMSLIAIGFPSVKRSNSLFYTHELIADLLGGSESSRLHQQLVKEQEVFSDIGCYHTESLDEGQLIISGRILPGTSIEEANEKIWNILSNLNPVTQKELEKVRNKKLTVLAFSELEVLNKAMQLAMMENMNKLADINHQANFYQDITLETINEELFQLFTIQKSSTLFYEAE